MEQLSQEMSLLVADASRALREMNAVEWGRTRGPGTWSRVEILGHLIDSAANNHQRFVRAAAHGDLVWPGYDQVAMVQVQQFGRLRPGLVLRLWESFNLYLAQMIAILPEERMLTRCTIGGDPPVTLEFLITDYVVHMQHHLRQIFEGMEVEIRWTSLS